MPSYLVTGASRGIGLGLVTELLKNEGNLVIATARDTAGSPGLQDLKARYKDTRLLLVDLDVSKLESIRSAVKTVEKLLPIGSGLDNLISNAGISNNRMKGFEEVDIEEFSYEVNFTITAPLMLTREFLPLIRKSQSELKKILYITSILGSVEASARLPGLMNTYSVARGGLNMMVRKWSPILKSEGIVATLVHPGWVGETKMGDHITDWVNTYNPDLENVPTEKSTANCVKILYGLTIEDSGAFFNHDGTHLPF